MKKIKSVFAKKKQADNLKFVNSFNKVNTLEQVKKILESSEINQVYFKKNTLLHIFCSKGYVDIVKYLLDIEGVDINCLNSFGQSPIYLAAQRNNLPVVELLLNKKELEIQDQDYVGNTIYTIVFSHKDMYGICISNDDNVKAEIIEKLIQKNVPGFDKPGNENNTPIGLALMEKNLEVVDVIMRKYRFINFNHINNLGYSVLHLICERTKKHFNFILSKKDIELDFEIKTRKTGDLFQYTCIHGPLENASYLYSTGKFDVNSYKGGYSLLREVLFSSQPETAKWLLTIEKLDILAIANKIYKRTILEEVCAYTNLSALNLLGKHPKFEYLQKLHNYNDLKLLIVCDSHKTIEEKKIFDKTLIGLCNFIEF